MGKHTEGPYRVVKSNGGIYVCGAAHGRIAEVTMCRTGQDIDADANMLASSWELREALIGVLAVAGNMADTPERSAAFEAACNALAKAIGQ